MKKIFFILAGVFLFAQFAIAQTTTAVTAPQILPDTVNMYYEIDTSKDNSVIDMVSYMLKSQIGTENEELFTTLFTDNLFSIGMNVDASAETSVYYAVFKATDDSYAKLLDSMSTDRTEIAYNNEKIIQTSESGFVEKFGNLVVITSSLDSAKNIVDNYKNLSTAKTLANNASYKAALGHNAANAFFFMYIDPKIAVGTTDPLTYNTMFSTVGQDYLSALTAETISIAQTGTGFDFSAYVEGDQTKLTALGMLMDKYNFTPSLYKKLSGTNLMFYAEGSNLAGSWTDMKKMYGDSELGSMLTSFEAMTKEATGLNLETDIVNLFTKGYAIVSHSETNSILPLTFIADVNANKVKAQANIDTMNQVLKAKFTQAETESGGEFYAYSRITVDGATFYQHKFTIPTDAGTKTLKLTFGITNSGLLVVSTSSDVAKVLAAGTNGLLDNSNFKAEFPVLDKPVSQLFYMDLNQIKTQVNTAISAFNAPQYLIDFIDGFFKPLHRISGISYATSNTSWGTGKLSVDVAGFGEYPAVFEKFYTEMSYEMTYGLGSEYTSSPVFCDVSETDWFYPFVSNLYKARVVNGYSDGCFHPDAPISRSEFTTMFIKAMQRAEEMRIVDDGTSNFDDVGLNYKNWYSPYVNTAAINDIVNGYNDGTFKPNNTITRAEAIQILYNYGIALKAQTGATTRDSAILFNDVDATAWYMNAIKEGYKYNLINGINATTFEPNRQINRAEAAKIISLYMDLIAK